MLDHELERELVAFGVQCCVRSMAHKIPTLAREIAGVMKDVSIVAGIVGNGDKIIPSQ